MSGCVTKEIEEALKSSLSLSLGTLLIGDNPFRYI